MYGLGLVKGLGITMKNMVLPGRMFTLNQYPDRRIGLLGLAERSGTNVFKYVVREPKMAAKAMLGLAIVEDRIPQHSRFRGEEFTWYEDRCTGCASCAKYCPLGTIRIITQRSGDAMLEGEKYSIEAFDIDIGRCMFCGLCVEACPYDALHMGSGFEEGTYHRKDLVIDADRLRAAPKRPSSWYRPQMSDAGYRPLDGQDASSADAGRHERPSLTEQEDRWGRR